MTVEERQLRAWVRSVFRHAALRWLDRQRRQETQEDGIWLSVDSITRGDYDFEKIDATLWWLDCPSRLAPRELAILHGLYQGRTPTEVAQTLRCNVSTVRRAIYRIRNQCPR